jgi:hypothetical protein
MKNGFGSMSVNGVKNGSDGPEIRLPLYPRDRTSPARPVMSVSCQEGTFGAVPRDAATIVQTRFGLMVAHPDERFKTNSREKGI